MTTALDLSAELVPSGIRDQELAKPRHRVCRACGEDLFLSPHAPRCPDRAEIYLSITSSPSVRRLEDLLAACTRKAWRASLLNGGRP